MSAPPRVEVIAQPFGRRALGDVLIEELQRGGWTTLRAVFAFLKSSGLRQIAGPLDSFLSGARATAVISVGIDHDGTSLEGLQDLWRVIDGRAKLFVFKEGQGGPARTFHPKGLLLERPDAALAIVGSGNLTAGGLFLNHELAVSVALDLQDAASARFHRRLRATLEAWQRPGAACREVDANLLTELYESGDLLPEAAIAAGARAARSATRSGVAAQTAGRPVLFGASGATALAPVPAPLPNMAAPAVTPPSAPAPAARTRARRPTAARAARSSGAHKALLIEVRPHHNGEVFLSKLAVNDDPGFFGYPFSGWTTPHRANNPPYPMAVPDPRVEIVVCDRRGRPFMRRPHSLNVVYYTRKSEIRITLPPEPLAQIPQFSLLVMTRNPSSAFDYRLEFLPPTCNSPKAQRLRAMLTRKLPSGGAKRSRYYGWA
jgi:HKD family nuclease